MEKKDKRKKTVEVIRPIMLTLGRMCLTFYELLHSFFRYFKNINARLYLESLPLLLAKQFLLLSYLKKKIIYLLYKGF
jgi:hypothetical protein